MGAPQPRVEIADLLDDRPADGRFRIHPEAFTDPAIFELELTHIFESTWVFVALESEIEKPHDYITRQVGRRSILLSRDADGRLRGFFNSCRHRGTLLCPLAQGHQKIHVCRYHGWTYDSAGRNVGVSYRDDAHYPPDFDHHERGLLPVGGVASYRGFIFVHLSAAAPSLEEHLGEAASMIDLIADQAPDGLEFIPGTAHYTFDANWKMQFENGLDAYHFPTTHAAFVNIIRGRDCEATEPLVAVPPTEQLAGGTISFKHGHAMSWSIGAPGQGAETRPLARDAVLFEKVRKAAGEQRLDWMLRQRNLTIFPNVQLIDIQSLQLRTWLPLSVNKTRMTSHCLAPKGESATARTFRIRQYEEFFNAGGLATSDDNVMYELGQAGFATSPTAPDHPYARGMYDAEVAASEFAGLEISSARCTYSSAGLSFGDETGIHSGYRQWHRLLLDGCSSECA